jgi:hypothetical protein
MQVKGRSLPSRAAIRHSLSNSRRSVGLCFSPVFFFLRSGTTCPGRGSPIRSRANALTAVTALNDFLFRLRGIAPIA